MYDINNDDLCLKQKWYFQDIIINNDLHSPGINKLSIIFLYLLLPRIYWSLKLYPVTYLIFRFFILTDRFSSPVLHSVILRLFILYILTSNEDSQLVAFFPTVFSSIIMRKIGLWTRHTCTVIFDSWSCPI